MGKKRKAGGRPFGQDGTEKISKEESKLRINTYEDVADSEDEFHMGRDKILLEEGPVQKRQRKLREDEEFLELSDEEVLAESSDVYNVDEDDENDEDDYEEKGQAESKTTKPIRGLQDSDTEASVALEDDEDLGGWGTSKRDYYNADVIETEADALEEEAEARRLQKKQLQGFTEADFGFDETEWQEEGNEDGEDGENGGNVVQEVLPRLEVTDAMGPEERFKLLRTSYPEFEPLAKEFLELQAIHEDLKLAADAEVSVQSFGRKLNDMGSGVGGEPISKAVMKHSALSAYLAALCMYFALFTSGQATTDGKATAMAPSELRDHGVMETLVQCRELWGKLKDMPLPQSIGLDTSPGRSEHKDVERQSGEDNLHIKMDEESTAKIKRKKVHKTKAQRAADAAQAEADARHVERLRKTEEDLASLSALTGPRKPSSKPATTTNKIPPLLSDDSDIGEQIALTAQEAAEKAKRKKSLRFYTSQIAQKSNKRDAAGRDAGGDADLPYRERFRDRQLRLNADAEARGQKPKGNGKGDEPLGGSSDEEDRRAAKDIRDDVDSDDYYDMVSSRAAAKKSSKAALAAAHAQAEREGGIVRVVEEAGVDGKRAITYAIEKNKGLTPRRKKDVRNPRVKKRKKYEEKKKKLGSMRPVYKGGEGKGGYGGELTGIKTGLVKSVRL